MPAEYVFHPLTAAELPLVRRWLAAPHVAEWWGNPDEQDKLVTGDLDGPAMEQYIVVREERPFAYLQCYELTAWNAGFGLHPDDTRGIDQFIGEADMGNRGHGSAFIRAFVAGKLASGTPRMVTDPDPKNGRAIRAYEKAGFVAERLVDTPDGRSLFMVCDA